MKHKTVFISILILNLYCGPFSIATMLIKFTTGMTGTLPAGTTMVGTQTGTAPRMSLLHLCIVIIETQTGTAPRISLLHLCIVIIETQTGTAPRISLLHLYIVIIKTQTGTAPRMSLLT